MTTKPGDAPTLTDARYAAISDACRDNPHTDPMAFGKVWDAGVAAGAASRCPPSDELRELRECVLDMCACLDVAGERADLGPAESGAWDYFATVSKNLGMARVGICHELGNDDYYDARYAHYKQEKPL